VQSPRHELVAEPTECRESSLPVPLLGLLGEWGSQGHAAHRRREPAHARWVSTMPSTGSRPCGAPSSWGHLHQLERRRTGIRAHIGPLEAAREQPVAPTGGWRSILARRILGLAIDVRCNWKLAWRLLRGLQSAWVHRGSMTIPGSRTITAFPTRKISPGRVARLPPDDVAGTRLPRLRNGRPSERTSPNTLALSNVLLGFQATCLRRHSDARDATLDSGGSAYLLRGRGGDSGCVRSVPDRHPRGVGCGLSRGRLRGRGHAAGRASPGYRAASSRRSWTQPTTISHRGWQPNW